MKKIYKSPVVCVYNVSAKDSLLLSASETAADTGYQGGGDVKEEKSGSGIWDLYN